MSHSLDRTIPTAADAEHALLAALAQNDTSSRVAQRRPHAGADAPPSHGRGPTRAAEHQGTLQLAFCPLTTALEQRRQLPGAALRGDHPAASAVQPVQPVAPDAGPDEYPAAEAPDVDVRSADELAVVREGSAILMDDVHGLAVPTVALPPPPLLTTLLDGQSASEFWRAHYLQQPYVGSGTAQAYTGLLSDGVLASLLATTCDCTAVRNGILLPGQQQLAPEKAWPLMAQGYSLVLRHVERHHEAIAQLAQELAISLLGELDVHIYVTPAHHFGFGWHYDAEEVFFIHTAGIKEFFLRRNTVNPHPVASAMPLDMEFERETSPIVHCLLEPGDWLYIPSGWWHRARAHADARSLSIGVLAPTPLAIVDSMRREMLQDAAWSKRLALPPGGPVAGEDRRQAVQEALALLATRLEQKLIASDFLQRWLEQRTRPAAPVRERHGWGGQLHSA